MADTIPTPKLTPPANNPSNSGGSWFSQHKGIAIGGGLVVLALGAYLIARSRSSSSTSNTTTPQEIYPSSATSGEITGYATYSSLANGINQTNTNTLDALATLKTLFETKINSLQSSINPGAATKQPTNQGSSSGGTTAYGSLGGIQNPANATIKGATGSTYVGVPTWGAATALLHSGDKIYWEPSQGVFSVAGTGGQLTIPAGTNTPLYIKK